MVIKSCSAANLDGIQGVFLFFIRILVSGRSFCLGLYGKVAEKDNWSVRILGGLVVLVARAASFFLICLLGRHWCLGDTVIYSY